VFISFPNAGKFGPIRGGIWANYVQDISGSQNNMGANFSVHLPIGVSLETVRDRAKVTINH